MDILGIQKRLKEVFAGEHQEIQNALLGLKVLLDYVFEESNGFTITLTVKHTPVQKATAVEKK